MARVGTLSPARADPLSGLEHRPANPTCVAGDRPVAANGVRLDQVFPQLASYQPFYMQQSPVDPDTWYFTTRDGKLYSFLAPAGEPRLVLDVSDRVGVLNESNAYEHGGSEHWGVSSFAFHPRFAINKQIFIQINGRQAWEKDALSSVVRFRLVTTPTGFEETFDQRSATVIIAQRQTNPGVYHHFGHIMFGPDGMLYIGAGDGSDAASVPRSENPAQRCSDLRGSILRINVNYHPDGSIYTIPQNNLYAHDPNCRPEIFASGLRNPWRFSPDPATGELWVGDVGAGKWEEIDRIADAGNYGWPIYEGRECIGTANECSRDDLRPPVDVTAHAGQSAAIIGGFVYRGKAMPWLVGNYIYSVFPRSELKMLERQAGGSFHQRTLVDGAPIFSSFFTDNEGEIYGITGHAKLPQVWKLIPETASSAATVPQRLSETGCFKVLAGSVSPQPIGGVIPYEVISPLWSDGAEKKRWLGLPDGALITINPDGDFSFPPGTVLIKEFSFMGVPFETRLLKRHNDGIWQGYTYAWRDDRSDADLVDADGMSRIVADTPASALNWWYPSRSQCLQCHTAAAGYALGPEMLQLNNTMSTTYFVRPGIRWFGNQLATWAAIGLFSQPLPRPVAELPSMTDPASPRHPVVLRARSYLHANCSGCHRPGGPTGKAIDFRYQTDILRMNVCNEVQAAGDIIYPGSTILTPQDPGLSALMHRVRATGVGQMPPIGRQLVDGVGSWVIATWIKQADVCSNGDIKPYNGNPDDDGDGVPDNADNCVNVYNPNQADGDADKSGNRCDGNWNGNLVADGEDRADLMSRMGTEFRRSPLWLDKYDLNGDGLIDVDDLLIFDNELRNHRQGPSWFRR
jgi:Glucose/sorbosone dehydrogenases